MRQIRALPGITALLAEDETDLLLFPPLRAGWSFPGQGAAVQITGRNARRTIFGAFHLRTGHMLCLDQNRKRIEEFLEFLDFIREHYRTQPVALLLDQNSIHASEQSKSLAEDLEIQLIWLPKRSPHLNPVDHLWRHGKQYVCANRQYESIDAQVAQFIYFFQVLSPTELLDMAGMFSKDFWLYRV